MKAFILRDEMTPEEYQVFGPASEGGKIILEQEDKEEARELQRQGKLLRTTDPR